MKNEEQIKDKIAEKMTEIGNYPYSDEEIGIIEDKIKLLEWVLE